MCGACVFCCPASLSRHRLGAETAFLWGVVRPGCWWWPVAVVMGRSLLIAACEALIPFGSIRLPIALFVVVLLNILLQVWVQPYIRLEDNLLEAALLSVALFVYLV